MPEEKYVLDKEILATYGEPMSRRERPHSDVRHARRQTLRNGIASIRQSFVGGSTKLYDTNNQLKYIPIPTPDPKDPLNLPPWRKRLAVGSLAIFGAVSIAAETAVASLVPVFIIYYSGISIKEVAKIKKLPSDSVSHNPLEFYAGLNGPPVWKVYFLASMPLLTTGLSQYLIVPLTLALGRRLVLVLCGMIAWTGAIWAGLSASLDSHVAALCYIAVGTAIAQNVLPLVIQDMFFIHERNRNVSVLWAMQGAISVASGVLSPIVIIHWGWRELYAILGGAVFVAWLLVCIFVPETRWERTPEELNGQSKFHLKIGEYRPELDPKIYGSRNFSSNFGIFNRKANWRTTHKSFIYTAKSYFFPNIFWIVLLNSAMVAIASAAAQMVAPVLLAKGWEFERLGFATFAILVASPVSWLICGKGGDALANYSAKKNGGNREPEMHLLNLIIPIACGCGGCILIGFGGEHLELHWMVIISGMFLIAIMYLSGATISSVYCVESYPEWAGPVLINVSAFRSIVGFALSFKVSSWVEERGYMFIWIIYAIMLGVVSMGLPIMYVYGKDIRRETDVTNLLSHLMPRDKMRWIGILTDLLHSTGDDLQLASRNLICLGTLRKLAPYGT
ncbi:MFS general substrate transporter [Eremomyces bilateralis CBS 781.70]|uniref:MFS general substrate transporter n=1 Tax=Eremomyces bilateralis CBS 781.70 TaxID=1392243 RepID=A0A6G1G432_9PEZI|nr:MFS general substrate transporter [Eremomyces bilateralis CBS 781.70]KAF1812742.1 MFS general substrate transporter [Eremomyces bilateralis CBS 781.70]